MINESREKQLRCGAVLGALHHTLAAQHRILAHHRHTPAHTPLTPSLHNALRGRARPWQAHRALSGNVVIFDMSRDNKRPPEGLLVSLFPLPCATCRGLRLPRRGGGEQSKAVIPSVTFSSRHVEWAPLSPGRPGVTTRRRASSTLRLAPRCQEDRHFVFVLSPTIFGQNLGRLTQRGPRSRAPHRRWSSPSPRHWNGMIF